MVFESRCNEVEMVLTVEHIAIAQIKIRKSATLHYYGQSFDLAMSAPNGPIDKAYLATLAESFGQEHERMYGHRAGPEEPVELVSIQVLGIGLREGAGAPDRVVSSRPEPPVSDPRQVYFGPDEGWLNTPIVYRSDLASARQGPLIVEEYDATCVVTPGATAQLDAGGNILILLEPR